jgi:hypothetical protein
VNDTVEAREAQRRADRWNKRHAGKPVHTWIGKGGYRYMYLFVDGKRHMLRTDRVAWALTHGNYIAGEIVHINGDNADDRLANLLDSGANGHALPRTASIAGRVSRREGLGPVGVSTRFPMDHTAPLHRKASADLKIEMLHARAVGFQIWKQPVRSCGSCAIRRVRPSCSSRQA